MEVFLDHLVAPGIKGKELESDVNLALILVLEEPELLVEEQAVGTEKIPVLDDLDGSILEALRGPGHPVRGNQAWVRDLGQAVVFLDNPEADSAELGVFFGVIKEVENICPRCQNCGGNDQIFEGRSKEGPSSSENALPFALKAILPEEKKAQERKEIVTTAEQTEALQKEQGIKEESDDTEGVDQR
jgi:hypothetical protein